MLDPEGDGGGGGGSSVSLSVCTGSMAISSLQLAAKIVTAKAKINGSFFSVFFMGLVFKVAFINL